MVIVGNIKLPVKLAESLRELDKQIHVLSVRKGDLLQGWLYSLPDTDSNYKLAADYSEFVLQHSEGEES